ncbi:MAG: NAD(P)-dependent oxidoreductase [Brevibacterium linens]
MNITVIGATGMVGSRIVAEAADRGHSVTAVSRTAPAESRRAITPLSADAGNSSDLDHALTGHQGSIDAAVLCVRAVSGHEDSFLTITEAVLSAGDRAGVPVLIVGGAGPLSSPNDPDRAVVDDPAFVPEPWRSIAAASVAQLESCLHHPNGNWTYLSPPAVLEPGARTGNYRRGTTTLLTLPDGRSSISAEDLAVAVIDELEAPRGKQRITVAY